MQNAIRSFVGWTNGDETTNEEEKRNSITANDATMIATEFSVQVRKKAQVFRACSRGETNDLCACDRRANDITNRADG